LRCLKIRAARTKCPEIVHSILSYIIVGGIGLLIAHFLSRAPELRLMRLSQLILVPAILMFAFYLLPSSHGRPEITDIGGLMVFSAAAVLLGIVLGPNIAFHCGSALCGFLDPHDWTPLEEEIALRPIQRLIDRDQTQQALEELDELLKKHKPTYEALLLKSKLLHHFGSVQETAATLLKMIELSRTTQQQLAVMDALAALPDQYQNAPKLPAPGVRRVQIRHELVLFPIGSVDRSSHKEIPPGSYKVEEIISGKQRWLRLAGEDWGNAEMCWEAIQETDTPKTPLQNFLEPIAGMHRVITKILQGERRPPMHREMRAKELLKEANRCIGQKDWRQALPLLQEASSCDPHSHEIAYRLVQAARHAESRETADQILHRVLRQSRWTEHEESMLLQG